MPWDPGWGTTKDTASYFLWKALASGSLFPVFALCWFALLPHVLGGANQPLCPMEIWEFLASLTKQNVSKNITISIISWGFLFFFFGWFCMHIPQWCVLPTLRIFSGGSPCVEDSHFLCTVAGFPSSFRATMLTYIDRTLGQRPVSLWAILQFPGRDLVSLQVWDKAGNLSMNIIMESHYAGTETSIWQKLHGAEIQWIDRMVMILSVGLQAHNSGIRFTLVHVRTTDTVHTATVRNSM